MAFLGKLSLYQGQKIVEGVEFLAKIIKQHKVHTLGQKGLIIWGQMALVVAIAMGFTLLLYRFNGLPTALWGLCPLLVLPLLWRQKGILAAGMRGEDELLTLLKSLPKEWTVLPDLEISHKNRRSQLDALLLGQDKMVILECKYVSGLVFGHWQDKELAQHKSREGKVYERKTLYNPLLQVEGHRQTLEGILRDCNLKVTVQTAVYFNNPHVRLDIKGAKNVFGPGEQSALLAFLQRPAGGDCPKDWKKQLLEHLHKK